MLIVKVAVLEIPPPGVGFVTVMPAVLAVAISPDKIVALNCVKATNVVVRGAPFHCTCELSTKLLPLAVSVNAALPAIALEGLKLLMTGTGFTAVVLNTQLLFNKLGSVIALLTEAVWIMVPVVVGVPVNVMVALAPLFNVPRLQVTKLVPVHVPVLGVTEAKPMVAVPDWMNVTTVARVEFVVSLLVTVT